MTDQIGALEEGRHGPAVRSVWDRQIRALTAGLVTIITLVAFEALAVVTVLPNVAADLDGLGLYGWATSAFFLGTTVGIVLAGAGADRDGPARPFAAGLLLAAVAPTMGVLVVGRGLQGLGGGAIPLRALRALPGRPGGGLVPIPIAPAVRISAGAGLVLAGLTNRSPLGLPLIAAGIACGLGPLRRLLPAGTLRLRPGIPAAVAVRGLLTWAFFGADTFVPLSITAVRHASITTAGLAVSSATLCWTAGSWTQARLVGRRPYREIIGTGLVLVALGTGGFTTVLLPASVPLAVPIASWGVAGMGMGMSYSTIVTLVLGKTPTDRQGVASTAVALSDNLGTAFGAGVSGVAVAASQATTGAPDTGLAVAFGLTVGLGLLDALVAIRRLPPGRSPRSGDAPRP